MYIEYVFLENFLIDFFILSCVQKILREKSRMIFLGAILGAVIAVICPLFNLGVFTSLAIKFLSAILLCSLCYSCKGWKKCFATFGLLLIITFVFGGAVELIKQAFGQVTILIVLGVSFAVFMLLKVMIKFFHKKKVVDNFSAKVCIIDGDKKVEEKGYFDSGNLLYDPISSKPICLITHEVFCKLYGGDVVSLFMKKINEKKLKNGHYITVNSAVKGGKMLVFSVDEMQIFDGKEEKKFKDVFLGLSFSGFEKAMNSKVLLHSSQVF